jgi:hypothetical protein
MAAEGKLPPGGLEHPAYSAYKNILPFFARRGAVPRDDAALGEDRSAFVVGLQAAGARFYAADSAAEDSSAAAAGPLGVLIVSVDTARSGPAVRKAIKTFASRRVLGDGAASPGGGEVIVLLPTLQAEKSNIRRAVASADADRDDCAVRGFPYSLFYVDPFEGVPYPLDAGDDADWTSCVSAAAPSPFLRKRTLAELRAERPGQFLSRSQLRPLAANDPAAVWAGLRAGDCAEVVATSETAPLVIELLAITKEKLE